MSNEQDNKPERTVIQVKEFEQYTGAASKINEFLKEVDVISVHPFYNTILGGIDYVVVYNEKYGTDGK